MGQKPISEIINIIKTKRYTYTKLQRAILHIILNVKKTDQNMNEGVQYIRVLGFRKEKEHLLTELSQKSSVPVMHFFDGFRTSHEIQKDRSNGL